jgi:hypothetical protein
MPFCDGAATATAQSRCQILRASAAVVVELTIAASRTHASHVSIMAAASAIAENRVPIFAVLWRLTTLCASAAATEVCVGFNVSKWAHLVNE